jgi:hypothetical protein
MDHRDQNGPRAQSPAYAWDIDSSRGQIAQSDIRDEEAISAAKGDEKR